MVYVDLVLLDIWLVCDVRQRKSKGQCTVGCRIWQSQACPVCDGTESTEPLSLETTHGAVSGEVAVQSGLEASAVRLGAAIDQEMNAKENSK